MSSKTTDAPADMQTIYEHPQPTLSKRMTFEEFLTSSDEATMSEWINGEAIYMSPASAQHQRIGSLLETILKLYVETHKLGEVFRAPFVMRLTERKSGREPDLLFVTHEHIPLIEKTYLNGAADLVVEIISPESVERDRGEKFVEYEQAGIREYWLIDPDRERAECYELGTDGRYRAATVERDGIYRSQVIAGFFVRPAWLWQTPSPTLEALRELKLI